MRLRRWHFADVAGAVIAALLIVGSIFALLRPRDMIVFHATGDMIGTQSGLIERVSIAHVRVYATAALVVGVALATFVLWALRGDETE